MFFLSSGHYTLRTPNLLLYTLVTWIHKDYNHVILVKTKTLYGRQCTLIYVKLKKSLALIFLGCSWQAGNLPGTMCSNSKMCFLVFSHREITE